MERVIELIKVGERGATEENLSAFRQFVQENLPVHLYDSVTGSYKGTIIKVEERDNALYAVVTEQEAPPEPIRDN